MSRSLTPKQRLFAKEYLVDLNATQAAIRAGYSEKTAYRIGAELLQKTSVSNFISEAMSRRAERLDISQDYILAALREIVERTMQAAPVMRKGEQVVDEDGNHVWAFDAKNACRALELLGKHLGMFTGEQVVKDEVKVTVKTDLFVKLLEVYASEERANEERSEA